MFEWHLSPEYIVKNWTDELLDLMVEKLIERRQREMRMMQPRLSAGDLGGSKVPDNVLFVHARNLIKVVKR